MNKEISKSKPAKYPFEGFRPEPDVARMLARAVRGGQKKSKLINQAIRLHLLGLGFARKKDLTA